MRRERYSIGIAVAAAGVFCAGSLCCLAAAPSCCAKAERVASQLSEKSLFQLESKWTTDAGNEITLRDLGSRPQVLVMFFANCQSACPILVHDLQKIETALKPELRKRVEFTLVTIDPRRDTPEALEKFRAARALPSETWNLLHGKPDDIQELAAVLGVKYKEEASGQFAHSNLITVLNSDGEIVHQLVGLGQDIKSAVRVIDRLLTNETAQVRCCETCKAKRMPREN